MRQYKIQTKLLNYCDVYFIPIYKCDIFDSSNNYYICVFFIYLQLFYYFIVLEIG